MSPFFIRRPIVAMVVSLVLVLGGLVTIRSLPIAQFPQGITPPQINIQTSYQGADPLTVEQAVAVPIEEAVNGVENMIYLRSINAADGTMSMQVTFDVDSNIDLDNIQTQNRLQQATPFLPAQVNQVGVTIRKANPAPLLLVSVYSPDDRYDPTFLSNYVAIRMRDDLLRVPGVGDVFVFGASNYAMRIWLQPDRLTALGITAVDVQNAVRAQNTVNPTGQIGAEPAPPGTDLTLTARAQGRLRSPEEFADIVVRALPNGGVVRLRDVARIELGAQTYAQRSRFDGRPASTMAVYQLPGTDALEVVQRVREKLKELSQSFPEGLAYQTSLDTTRPVTEGIREILITLVAALLLVMAVVFLFLQSARATLIPLLTVPVSLIGAFLFFPPLGFSINTLSLFGLVLAIGLVVDDAIVVVEAVSRHIEEGMTPLDASFQAMREVQGPVISIALILSSVFIPVAFVSGISGRMYKQFAITIALSVLISAFNALSLSPALCALLLRPHEEGRRGRWGARAFRWFNRAFERTTRGYVRLTHALVRRAAFSLLAVGLFAAAAILLARRTPKSFIPTEDLGYCFINVSLPDGASLQRTDAAMAQMEEILRRTPGIAHVNTVVGYSILSTTASTNFGSFFITLERWSERKAPEESAEAIVTALNRKLAAVPAATAFAILPPSIPGISATGGLVMELQDVGGNTPEYLEEHLQRFLVDARRRPELTQVQSQFRASVPQLYIDVDRDQLLQQGASIADVYATLQTFLAGVYVNDFTLFGRPWRVYVGAEPKYRANTDALAQFSIRTQRGGMIPITQVLRIRNSQGPQYITRFNLYRAAEVTATPAPGYSSAQAMDALTDVAHAVLPGDMRTEWSALAYQQQRTSGVGRSFALAVVFVFLVLAALYESWSLPWSVLLTTPVAVLGAYLGLTLRAFPSDVFAEIGLIMLVGLAAKNAILIVEFARARRAHGLSVEDAAVEGARIRLRPILMTSLAFIFGCLPLWFATGSGAVSRRELGTVVITGMLVATVFGVLLVPPLYAWVERLAERWKAFRQRRRRPAVHPATEAPR
ncbi:MAG: efflux RND transporter permease subunit [Myxococcaceae bacterium]|nr:efflux RND transporter permease subunit [Myxococcaceae bacterium]